MEVRPTRLEGCVEVRPAVHSDDRGLFVKPFHASSFVVAGLPTAWREHFYSRSSAGVIRGLHFQLPPLAQDKLVCCVRGKVFDVVIDLRVGSPTYGQSATFFLDDDSWRAVFVPSGMAHGFAALDPNVVMAYAVTAEHVPDLDAGIRWDSVGIKWPVDAPVVSRRDALLPHLDDFTSPFVFRG